MLASRFYMPTLREAPADAEMPSHRLLLRGGFIRPLSAGIFTWLPLGQRVLQRVENVVREEMNRAGAHEVLMPVLHPRDLWERSGRWDTFQPTPLRVTDRAEREFCLGPTHEEVITDLIAMDLDSYRELPVTLYQIQVKFRDEIRPRGGLIRGKEFIMKDAYSFDRTREGLDTSYDAMYDAYVRIFERLRLPVVVVEAEAGSIGGTDTREFMLLSENGEDTVYMCDSCDYASNAECATAMAPEPIEPAAESHRELVSTPDAKTVEQVTGMLGTTPDRLVKTLLYRTDEGFIAALVRGDRSLNEFKLARIVHGESLRMADEAEVRELTGARVGFAGPVGLPENVRIIADYEVQAMSDFVTGANQDDAHFTNVNLGADFEPDEFADLREACHGDSCAHCDSGALQARRCIEMAHVFKLGTNYSEALDATFRDADGHEQPCIMGCYGIGVSRIVSALVEQYHDDAGIMWPRESAPFDATILLLSPDDEELRAVADNLYAELREAGIEVLYDERDASPGVKFAEADLIGAPVRAVVGRTTKKEGKVELRRRVDGEEQLVPLDEAVKAIVTLLGDA
ncbi:MAG: proline--tRNA ligase [candidate division WS1 bacterium]|nr:proline--tRNA ligase [candidate division WS1 bacterium]